MDEPTGYQWITDPTGHRWRVESFNEVAAQLRDADGREIGVGRTILQHGFASGAWQMAEFQQTNAS